METETRNNSLTEATALEREGDYENYAICFIESQHAGRKRAWRAVMSGELCRDIGMLENVQIGQRLKQFFELMTSFVNDWIWGYGERPFRTLAAALAIIVMSGIFYANYGGIGINGVETSVDYLEGLYFSAVTFATVGYGDFTPLGLTRLVSIFEFLSGIVLVPLFLIVLTCRYLRMYR